MNTQDVLAPGARVVVRDAEWLVRRVDNTATGGKSLNVVGISELVRNKEAIFLTEIEPEIEILDPAKTELVQDTSSGFRDSLLYMEGLLRQKAPTDENLYIGHRAAMDQVSYQLDPAIQALRQPRQRILMADAVGLGKTLECGVLLSELIRRGKGKRILVLAIKSMLTQFQKELWSRFSIPLTRLDSIGIQRIRSKIPTNHNPFYYYDKSIISIDTLKQDAEYRNYIENAYWDVIVIDEAHNVAQRGKGSSLRARLAKLVSGRSDTLIMLSATPHDGRAKSFASLMNMLDPTAIADPEKYTKEDIKGLFIRRFKKDIKEQVQKAFPERKIGVAHCEATREEEAAFDALVDMKFTRLDRKKRTGSTLFKTTLEKSLFSSPAACIKTIQNRISRLQSLEDSSYDGDIQSMNSLAESLEGVDIENFSRYQKLLKAIKDSKQGFGWTGKDKLDRLVIFTERIETLKFLQENLQKDLKLKPEQVEILHGGLGDKEQQNIVEEFGKEEAGVRLLIASDVASEGINLHFLCNKMIHFDIPWSLMVFQQRNGRIDRYGQERKPNIIYLVTKSQNQKIHGDTRILELLIEKDQQAQDNIGDPSALMGVYDIEEEENITARAIEENRSVEDFDRELTKNANFDALAFLRGDEDPPDGEEATKCCFDLPSLFKSNFDYLKTALENYRKKQSLQVDFYPKEKRIDLTAPENLEYRFRYFPVEIWPEQGGFILSEDKEKITEEIKRSRKDEKAWPKVHYLWELNPVVEWMNDEVLAAFSRHEAPVLTLKEYLKAGETIFIISGLIPNRKSHPLLHQWFALYFNKGKFEKHEEFNDFLKKYPLGLKKIANPEKELNLKKIKDILPLAIQRTREVMSKIRKKFELKTNEKLQEQMDSLEKLQNRQLSYLEQKYEGKQQTRRTQELKEKERREINKLFDNYLDWVQETMTTEDNPFIQVIAVLTG
ncbi:DEAD/DEAH box helicase [Candidatus Riflebacteria bacterium]